MRTYRVYLGSAEQFAYTFEAKNQAELRLKIRAAWMLSFEGRWYKQPVEGCPRGSKRYRVGKHKTPILIIPER
jgi:hypothetical protein